MKRCFLCFCLLLKHCFLSKWVTFYRINYSVRKLSIFCRMELLSRQPQEWIAFCFPCSLFSHVQMNGLGSFSYLGWSLLFDRRIFIYSLSSITMLTAHKHIVILQSFLQKYFDLNCSMSNDVFWTLRSSLAKVLDWTEFFW